MPPVTKLPDVSELTKEMIADLYFRSLGNIEMRKSHIALAPKLVSGVNPSSSPPASIHDIEMDFTGWYGGMISLAYALDEGVELPTTKEMLVVITPQFERVKKAMAA